MLVGGVDGEEWRVNVSEGDDALDGVVVPPAN